MTIHWQWLPLIVTAILLFLYEVSDRAGFQMQVIWGALAAMALTISILIYIFLLLKWLVDNIHII